MWTIVAEADQSVAWWEPTTAQILHEQKLRSRHSMIFLTVLKDFLVFNFSLALLKP